MKRNLLTGLVAVLAVVSMAIAPAVSHAQTSGVDMTKPVAIVSIAGYEAVTGPVAKLVAEVGGPQAAMMVQMMVPSDPPGIDKTKPAGAIVMLNGMQPTPLVFIPVSDIDAVLQLPSGMLPSPDSFDPPTPKADSDGIYELFSPGPNPLFVIEKNGWAFASTERDLLLGDLPTDPVALLDGLNEQYSVAVKVLAGNIPDMLKQTVPGMLQMAQGMQPMNAQQKQMMQQSTENVMMLVDGTDTILVGLSVADDVTLDVEMVANDGSDLATAFAAQANATTDFAGFFDPTALLTLRGSQKITDLQKAQMKAQLDIAQQQMTAALTGESGLSDNDQQLTISLVTQILEVAQATIADGKIDFGATLSIPETNSGNLLIGAYVVEGAKLEDSLKKLAQLAMDSMPPQLTSVVQLDADAVDGVNYHTVTLPIEMMGPGAPPELDGKIIEVIVGCSDSAIYLGAGVDGVLDSLKAAIATSASEPGKSVPGSVLSVSAGQLVNIVPENGPSISDILPSPPTAADTITITGSATETSAMSQLVVSNGMIKLLGQAIIMGVESRSAASEMQFDMMEEQFNEDEMEGSPF